MPKSVQEVAQNLNNLAKNIQVRSPHLLRSKRPNSVKAAVEHLQDLAQAVTGGPSQATWAASEITQLINPTLIAERVVGNEGGDSIIQMIESLRNILVLAPLAVTWFGISQAVGAYHDLLLAAPLRAGESFIFLWQDGFGGRNIISLSNLALVDFCLLAFVFLLTLGVQLLDGIFSNQQDQECRRLREEITQTLADATLALAPLRLPQPYVAIHQIYEMAQKLEGTLEKERERLGQLAERREKELEDLSSFTNQLNNSLANLITQLNQDRATYTKELSGNFAGFLGDLGKDREALLRQLTTELGNDITELGRDRSSLMADLEKHLSALTAELSQGAGSMRSAVDTLRAEVARTILEVNSILTGNVQSLRQATSALSTSVDGLSHPISEMAQTQTNEFIPAARSVGTKLDEYIRQQKSSNTLLDQLSKDHQKLADGLLAQTAEISVVVTRTTEMASNTERMTASLVAGEMHLVASIQNDLAQLLSEYRLNVDRIMKASEGLENAAQRVEQTALGLANTLNPIQ